MDAAQRIQRNQHAKALRYVERFLHQMRALVAKPEYNAEALAKALAIVDAATEAQWAALAASMTAENKQRGLFKVEAVPSGATREIIRRWFVDQIEMVKDPKRAAFLAATERTAADDTDLVVALVEQRLSGSTSDDGEISEEKLAEIARSRKSAGRG